MYQEEGEEVMEEGKASKTTHKIQIVNLWKTINLNYSLIIFFITHTEKATKSHFSV
ncbi:hypothetical protein Glove_276g43 [Diversispora epigaea]|uniref:Uncharacterized protein n=1 Tax=Diversispora epigaea TaxID=1348612 RepID=A0A397I2T1_9GLOM|nr:hypothetical protein Glove_276g43 [Diversispora epigaea]